MKRQVFTFLRMQMMNPKEAKEENSKEKDVNLSCEISEKLSFIEDSVSEINL